MVKTPDFPGSFCIPSNESPTHWFRYEAHTSGRLTLDTCGTPWLTSLSLYRDPTPCPTDATTVAACSTTGNTGCQLNNASLTVPVVAGRSYLFSLAGLSLSLADSRVYTLRSSFVPTNETCATADPLQLGATPFDNRSSFTEGELFTNCYVHIPGAGVLATVDGSLWYTFTAPCNSIARLSFSLATFNPRMVVIDQCGGGTIACIDNFDNSRNPLVFQAQIGRTYKIIIGGNNSRVTGTPPTPRGVGSLNFSYDNCRICPADVDDGSATGRPDGAVTIDDLLYYIEVFNQGLVAADIDDGSGTGTREGGVTIDDLLYYIVRYEQGC
jgi:hypothetical protein